MREARAGGAPREKKSVEMERREEKKTGNEGGQSRGST